ASQAPLPQLATAPPPPVIEPLPKGDPNTRGKPPPMPAEASPQTREQKRFARYDRDRDGVITRLEMMGSRTKAFKALDKDGDNLLSFEEWAVATSDRFASADANKDGKLTPAEFATTAPKRTPKPKCTC
ncbi:EF-hand domain-containing protein, partial [uncultured Sphingobium sp.]